MLFLATSFTGPGNVFKLIGLIILCIIIIAASYYTTKFIGQKQMGNVGESNFKSIDVYRINQNKYIQILQVANKYIVIAVCKDTVTLLGELDESEITFKSKDKKYRFKDILDKVSAAKEDENVCEAEDNGTADEDSYSSDDVVLQSDEDSSSADEESLANEGADSDCETDEKTE